MRPLGPLAVPLSILYAAGGILFRRTYAAGFFRRQSFPTPVLSIGNIEAGGTGKTPLVLSLCERLLERKVRPGVVSRGYGRISPSRNLFVSRGDGFFLPVEEAGDEPALVAHRFPMVPVVVSADRIEGLSMLDGLCDLALLDDGFQSLEIIPKASLVFLPAFLEERPARLTDLLPSGSLREPANVLVRASHWVMISCGDMEKDKERAERVRFNLSKTLKSHDLRPILFQRFYLSGIISFSGEMMLAPKDLFGIKVALLAGIANPERVLQGIRNFGAEIVGMLTLPDHVHYSENVMGRVARFAAAMKGQGASMMLTTEKDRVKWRTPPTVDLPVGVLVGQSELLEPDQWDDLLSFLLSD